MQSAGAAINPKDRWTSAEWLLLFVLAAVQFTNVLDFLIMMPLCPRYLKDLRITTQDFGWLVSAYAFSACLSGLAGAFIIDRFDRKQALLFLAWGFTGGTALCALAPGYWVLMLGRCLAGFFGGMLGALVLAIIGDAFHENRRGLATGVVMSAFSIATIAGVPAGLTLADWFGTWAPFAALAGLAALMTILAGFVFPPMRRHLTSRHQALDMSTANLLVYPAHLCAYLLMICLVLGMFTIVPFLATYMLANVGLTPSGLIEMYFFGGLATLISMSIVGHLADRFGKLLVFRIMAVLTIGAILLVTNLGPTAKIPAILAISFMMVVTSGRMVPAMAMITSSALPAYRGRFMSVVSSVQQAAMGLAAIVAGYIVKKPEENGPLEGFPIVGILACITTVASIIMAGYLKPKREKIPGVVFSPQDSILASSEVATVAAEAAMTGVVPQPEAFH